MANTEKLIELLSNYFGIGDSYHYILHRDKEAFYIGTMELNDFEEYEEDDVAEIAEYLIDNEMIVKTGQWVTGDKMTHYPRVPFKVWLHYCTACEHVALSDWLGEEILTEYCPFCGARMEG